MEKLEPEVLIENRSQSNEKSLGLAYLRQMADEKYKQGCDSVRPYSSDKMLYYNLLPLNKVLIHGMLQGKLIDTKQRRS